MAASSTAVPVSRVAVKPAFIATTTARIASQMCIGSRVVRRLTTKHAPSGTMICETIEM